MKRRGFLAGLLSLFAAPELPTAKGKEAEAAYIDLANKMAKEKKAKS